MSFIKDLLGRASAEAQQYNTPMTVQQPTDTRSPFERIRDNYDLLHQKYSDRRVQLERYLEQLKTDLSECEAIIISLEAGRQALNSQIVERGLLGNDSILRGIEEQKD